MAKGNLFQGMARGKVGDVVFSRANGEQISRVRNRHPKNPRSNAQLYQRAIMATVIQAYSAGKAIFDHSFQGLSVGAGNQREFIRLNANKLRSLIAADLNSEIPTTDMKGRVIAPKSNYPVAFPMVISRGSYEMTAFSFVENAEKGKGYQINAPSADMTVASYLEANNLIPGDIYTFVVFERKDETVYKSSTFDDVLASQQAFTFGYLRLTVKDVATSEDKAETFGQVFVIESNGLRKAEDFANFKLATDNFIGIAELTEGTETGGIGLIRSRKDVDLRSNSELNVIYGSNADDMFGIAPTYILDAWKNAGEAIGDSELILEGGGL